MLSAHQCSGCSEILVEVRAGLAVFRLSRFARFGGVNCSDAGIF